MMIEVHKKSYEPKEIINHANKACGWFVAIAIFSVINSALIFFKSNTTFVIGLGFTTIVDGIISGIRKEAHGGVANVLTVIGFIINFIVIGIYVLIWYLSKIGSKAAYIIGMVLYALDSLIFFIGPEWVGLGFHAFFLFSIITGYGFVKARAQAVSMLANQPQILSAENIS